MKKRLSELANISAGYSFRTSVERDPEGNVWVLRPGDVDSYGGVSKERMTRTAGLDASDRYRIDGRVVLLVTYGEDNRAYHFDDLPPVTIASSGFTLIRPHARGDTSVLAPYLAWYLNQEPAQAFYEAFRRGSTTTTISRKSLGALKVPVPPVDVQRRIGDVDALARKEAQLTRQWIAQRRLLIDHSLLQRVS